MKKRVFSGIQPTGSLHIGNYLAAIRRWVTLQSACDSIYCIVDLHAITVPQDPFILKSKIRELAGLLIASGVDPAQATIFVQSHVAAHAQLAWIMNCFIPMGWMQRMTQFKEKSKEQKEEVSTGLFDYPALMAADILLYQTDLVPVGEDQKQHVELARNAARRFNSMYGTTFTLPEPFIAGTGGRIMGLEDPTKKMSKSEDHPGQAIGLLDDPQTIRRKISRATTDSHKEIRFDRNRPGINNLLVIYQLLSELGQEDIEGRFLGKGYADLKRELSDLLIDCLQPIQARYRDLMKEPAEVDGCLEEGASRARPIAEQTLQEVKKKIGLG